MNKIFEIDDGAQHTIAADTIEEAFGVYAEHLIMSGADWPDEKPGFRELSDDAQYTLRPEGDETKVKLSIRTWRHLYSKPQYIGCSDF